MPDEGGVSRAAVKIAVAALIASGWWTTCASGKDLARLRVAFTPDRPGASTTIVMRYEMSSSTGGLPSPVTDISLRLPAGIEGTANLGMAVCDQGDLEDVGVVGCPRNAKMGFGKALVAVPLGLTPIYEPVKITAFMGRPQDGHTAMLFYAEGNSPVAADLVLMGQLLPDDGLFGERLDTVVPLTPSVPEGPDASLIRLQAEIGATHILYEKRKRDKVVLFKPEGPVIPRHCPQGGFPFVATISFQDRSQVTTTAQVPCTKRIARHAIHVHGGARSPVLPRRVGVHLRRDDAPRSVWVRRLTRGRS